MALDLSELAESVHLRHGLESDLKNMPLALRLCQEQHRIAAYNARRFSIHQAALDLVCRCAECGDAAACAARI